MQLQGLCELIWIILHNGVHYEERRPHSLRAKMLYSGIISPAALATGLPSTKARNDFSVVVTQGGSTSQRNYERVGFSVAYSKATLVKPFESP